MAKYVNLGAVQSRLESKVRFAESGDLDPNKLSQVLFKSLVNEAETQIEIDLMLRYEIPFQGASGTFNELPLTTKTFLTTLAELLSVVRILETDFGRGTSANADKYTEQLQKRYNGMIAQLVEIKKAEKVSYQTWSDPLFQGLKLAYNNQADTGFRGKVIVSTTISHEPDYAYKQMNSPSENIFNGWLHLSRSTAQPGLSMDDLVKIDFKMPDYLERFKAHFQRLQIAIASDIQTNIGLRFSNEGAYNGHEKWKDSANKRNLKKAKNGLQVRQILNDTGALKNSLSPRGKKNGTPGESGYVAMDGTFEQSIVTVGTSIKYARIHNEGGVIEHPGTDNGFGEKRRRYKVKRDRRRIFIGKGLKIKEHLIHIPRRNFTDWNDADQSNIGKVIKNTITEILNGR